VSKNIIIEGISVLLVATLLQYCKAGGPPTEEEQQIRSFFEQLARDLPGASPDVITPYLTESAHHESAGPYHHRVVLESLMEFSSMENLTLTVQNVMVGNDRAYVRCKISARLPGTSGSGGFVEKDQIFEMRREPSGWRIADHRLR
jgi:hypothetical protein